MDRKITYREIRHGEEEKTCLMVMDCFSEFVAPGYSKEGLIEFSKYVNPKFTAYRLAKNHFIMLALDNDILVGVIEVRNDNHISLFFVKKEYQNKGIGKKLHELAINKCKLSKQDVAVIDVNSSPYAVPIYEKFGFTKVKDEQTVNGMRFIPMELRIKN